MSVQKCCHKNISNYYFPLSIMYESDLGQDVILPCKVPSNIIITAVEWIRPDQEAEYILFYWNRHINSDNQHPSYQNRVDLQDKEMKDGNFSLILKNLMKNDTGRYKCHVFEEGKNEPISITYLVTETEAAAQSSWRSLVVKLFSSGSTLTSLFFLFQLRKLRELKKSQPILDRMSFYHVKLPRRTTTSPSQL
uniref:Ig-like domain-containing protein n=1 Tax=Acanthochromis polyacanthus TaxID=80966 RepID=A0A3Q1FLC9_9TELE